ncbi:hypothetical protein EZV62_020123 [Acer yangbiense]|uniref:Cytochrome P450 n=1 Tax=Acer yangbiense TaxID=1000413 RepID=A0A5C7HD72_9ROSI|nr:hypothetical protein EZV62_020123 [Acer yangbiense]
MTIFMSLFSLQPWFLVYLSMILYVFHAITCEFLRVSKLSGPPTLPIIGCLISFYKNRHRLLDWYTELLAKSATNTIVVDRIGARRTIVTANPENVEYMLKTNFNNFPKGKPFTEILGDFLGYGIFNVDGELWRTQRKLASHEFSANSMREFVIRTLKEEVENRLLPVLEALAKTSEVVDLQELLRRLSFNMICKVSLGIDRCCLDPSSPDSSLAEAFDMASLISARRGAAPLFLVWKMKKLLGIGSERRLKNAVDVVHEYVEEIMHEKKKKVENYGQDQDLLSRLILAGQEEEVIRDMMISLIMAGRDTTSAAMTWFFWLISRHPEIEQELDKETEFMNDKVLDYESLKELKLLKACLCESMRLYPPVAWDSKHAITDDILPDGTRVQAGDRVTYFPYGMGRTEALWGKDWFEFKPDRWFTEPNYKRGEPKQICPFKFPVFQAGPRVCLGKEMAFIQMKYVVASVLRRFEIRPVRSDQPVFVPLLTAHMAGGLKVSVRQREKLR